MTKRSPRLFWPIVLIGVGLIFLLNNMGVIVGSPWPVIWRMWPVLLIALGVEILLGRQGSVGAIVSGVIGLALVGFVLWILVARPPLPGFSFGGALETRTIEYPLKDIRSASVSIGFTTGSNQLDALSDSDQLIAGTIQHYGTLNFDASDSGSQASVRLNNSAASFGFNFGGDSEERWNISLNPKVAYDLTLDMGIGQSTIDLSRLTVTGGRVNAGVGTTELRLPATGRFSMDIDGGVGTVRLRLPGSMALRVEVDTGIGTFNSGSRLNSKGDNVYETAGFSNADNAITLHVKVGIGTISVIDSE